MTVLLVALVINLAGGRLAYAASKEEKQARYAEKIKANVLKLGTGESTRVKVKLQDKTKLEGYIGDTGEEGFTVTNQKPEWQPSCPPIEIRLTLHCDDNILPAVLQNGWPTSHEPANPCILA